MVKFFIIDTPATVNARVDTFNKRCIVNYASCFEMLISPRIIKYRYKRKSSDVLWMFEHKVVGEDNDVIRRTTAMGVKWEG